MSSDQAPENWCAQLQDSLIYSFHMPLFFILAGITYAGGAKNISFRQYFKARLRDLIYPYILWSIISILLSVAVSGQVNNPASIGAIFMIWAVPVFQYWFIYALFIVQMIYKPMIGRYWIAIGLSLYLLSGLWPPMPPILIEVAIMFPFFAAGVLAGPWMVATIDRLNKPSLLLALVVSVAIFWVSWTHSFGVHQTMFAKAGLSAIGSVMVILASVILAGRLSILIFIGQASMAIYLLHTIMSAGSRMVLKHLGMNVPIVTLLTGTVLGLICPIIVKMLSDHYGVTRKIGLGATAAGKVAPASIRKKGP